MSAGDAESLALQECKRTWRERLRQRRRAVTGAAANAAAGQAAERLAASPLWRSAEHVGIYLASDGELDPARIAARARREGKRLYLPAVRGGEMQFLGWDPERELVANRYRILEPDAGAEQAPRLDLLLLPLVGWTGTGFRLGMGGGYFDRFLADPARQPRVRIGLAYECQREDALEVLREPWDQGVDGVLTERALYLFGAAPGAR